MTAFVVKSSLAFSHSFPGFIILKHESFSTVLGNDSVADAEKFHTDALASLDISAPVNGIGYKLFKIAFDFCISILLLPVAMLTGLALLLLNPWFNRGPLFYAQTRMGKDCKAFRVYKFRTMAPAPRVNRRPDDPVESHRITRMGSFLRKVRLDELPQLFNVFKRQMSLIGPRPDFFSHAKVYKRNIPGYRERHATLPGISGYAQTEVGYAEGTDATYAKVRADLYYIKNQSISLDMWLLWRTVKVVFVGDGL